MRLKLGKFNDKQKFRKKYFTLFFFWFKIRYIQGFIAKGIFIRNVRTNQCNAFAKAIFDVFLIPIDIFFV